MAIRSDKTGYIPAVLFIILAGIVTYCIIKGSSKKLTQEQIDAIYNHSAE